jgi:hypothetical protein
MDLISEIILRPALERTRANAAIDTISHHSPCGRWRLRLKSDRTGSSLSSVVCSDGDLAGYRWGVDRKREMIRREGMA